MKPTKKVANPSAESERLMAEARQLRAEAATLEKELGLGSADEAGEGGGALPVAAAKNNILSLAAGPKWKTQIWLGPADDRPFLRTGWTLREGGEADVEAGLADAGMRPGWRLVGDAKEKLFESWFWIEGKETGPPTKFTLKTTATPEAECNILLDYEKQAKANLETCLQRIRDADAEDSKASNPLAWVMKLHARTLAVDELVSARQVAKEYEHHAERAKGATLSLDGVTYTLGGRGAVVASKGEGDAGTLGSFSSWLASR